MVFTSNNLSSSHVRHFFSSSQVLQLTSHFIPGSGTVVGLLPSIQWLQKKPGLGLHSNPPSANAFFSLFGGHSVQSPKSAPLQYLQDGLQSSQTSLLLSKPNPGFFLHSHLPAFPLIGLNFLLALEEHSVQLFSSDLSSPPFVYFPPYKAKAGAIHDLQE